ncbi:olfactory receptor 52P1-like [Hyperolius riggenbachi]|uniref:olfactory receptor 52P1-like n=1 Tax=Hyperolius riggenbachi TaxID=752182 RepID=UPI0035A28010
MNQTQTPQIFILTGIPGLEYAHPWFSIPVLIMYVLALVGNFITAFVILSDEKLHKPMYLLLVCLAVIEMLLTTTTTPKILSIFWLDSREIGFTACLTQLFFIHSLSMAVSAIMLAMSFDRYVAICLPLRYNSILKNPTIAKIGILAIVRGSILVGPEPFFAQRLSYCRTNVIAHTYCEHMAVVKIACSNTSLSRAYGLTVALMVIAVDMIFITASYCAIGRAVYRLSSKEARQKALNTCGPHICVILVGYGLAVFSFLSHRLGHNIPVYVHIILANLYILIPPMSNPLIYGARIKEIQEKIVSIFCKKTFKGARRPL